jgi:hypothetical protein
MRINEVVNIISEDVDKLYNIIDDLNADDVGEERSGQYVLKYEGFSDWCQQDAAERCELPDGDRRKLNAYEDVYDEVIDGWNKEMGSEPIDTGFSGDEDYPVQWAIYDTGVSEDLRKWFKQKWVRFGPDGKIDGPCARGSSKEGKPKCLPQKKAHALGKKGRASSARRKRREDPNANRRGKAKNVSTKGKK